MERVKIVSKAFKNPELVRRFQEEFLSPESRVLLTSYPIELIEDEAQRQILILQRLNALLKHARRTRFYSNYPPELDNLGQFSQLPIISKEDLIKNFEGTVLSVPRIGMQYYQTSGTSGVHLSNIRNSLELQPHFQRAARFFNYAVENPEEELFLNLLYYGGRWSGGIGAHSILTEALLNFVPLGPPTSPEELVKNWQETKPTGAFISPPWFVHITRQLEEKKLLSQLPTLLSRIFYLGESLTISQREYLTERTITRDTKIHSIYASTEAGMIGLQVFPEGPLFIVPDSVYIEIVDDNGNPLPPGNKGNIVVTSFNRLTQPIIRYNTGDLGRILPEEELFEYRNYGFYAPAIELLGRSNNDFKLGDGFVNGEQIVNLVGQSLNLPVLNWQIIIDCAEDGKTLCSLTIESTVNMPPTFIDPYLIAEAYPELENFLRENVALTILSVPSGTIQRVGPTHKILHVIDRR